MACKFFLVEQKGHANTYMTANDATEVTTVSFLEQICRWTKISFENSSLFSQCSRRHPRARRDPLAAAECIGTSLRSRRGFCSAILLSRPFAYPSYIRSSSPYPSYIRSREKVLTAIRDGIAVQPGFLPIAVARSRSKHDDGIFSSFPTFLQKCQFCAQRALAHDKARCRAFSVMRIAARSLAGQVPLESTLSFERFIISLWVRWRYQCAGLQQRQRQQLHANDVRFHVG